MNRTSAVGILLLLLTLAIGQSLRAEEAHTVTTASGPIVGHDHQGTWRYLGIPYAKAPEGPRRWQAPVPIDAWTKPLVADSFPSPCPSTHTMSILSFFTRRALLRYMPVVGSEDCLFLNVWEPQKPSVHPRPVMVFIHGGGFFFGSTGERFTDLGPPLYEASRLAAREDVVVVSMNYRLGFLGYFAHPELKDSQGRNEGNFGLQDQLLALRWVQDHIAAFGGDPQSVTIFGESAGASSVEALLATDQSSGLFHKAIMQSPLFLERSHEAARDLTAKILQESECKDVACLRSLPSQKLAQIGRDYAVNLDTQATLITGTATLPDPTIFAGIRRRQLKIPIIVGVNQKELLSRIFHENIPYDTAIYCNARALPKLFAPEQVYAYWFNHSLIKGGPAMHVLEVPFVFGTIADIKGPFLTSEDENFSKQMSHAWAEFARSGHPGSEAFPWPTYGREGTLKTLNLPGIASPTDLPSQIDCQSPWVQSRISE